MSIMNTATPLRIGLIGLGAIGKIHADVLQNGSTRFTLSATGDPRNTGVADITHYPDFQALLDNKILDAVAIATPPNTHYDIARDALLAGKHVLVEKPPTLTVEESNDLLAIANANKRIIFTAFHFRYKPEVLFAKSVLPNIKHIQISLRENAFRYHDPKKWIFDPSIAGGGVLIDNGINDVSALTFLMPRISFRPRRVILARSPGVKVETRAEIEFDFGENGTGELSLDWVCEEENSRTTVLSTTEDTYTIDYVRGSFSRNERVLFDSSKTPATDQKTGMWKGYQNMYVDFWDHIQQRAHFLSTKELAFVLDCYQRAKQ